MEVLLFLVPLSLMISIGFVWACLKAVKNGQYTDIESPRWRILFDEPARETPPPINLKDSFWKQ